LISIETDSHGRVYQIWKQEQASSCGVASAWMARGIARQMSFAEEEWDLAHRIYAGAVASALSATEPSSGPMSMDPRAFPSDQSSFGSTFTNFGLFTSQVATALQSEGLHAQTYADGGNPIRIVHSKIAFNKPGIAFVKWNGANSGAHFVVVGRCTSHQVSFLDPWNGHVNEQANNSVYNAPYGGQGRIKHVIYISA
jgi:hypothetical protein